jgi:hypothetical protein
MKKLSKTKFHNFWRSATFILVVSSTKVIWDLQPVGSRQAYLPDMAHKMISNQKVVNYEVS